MSSDEEIEYLETTSKGSRRHHEKEVYYEVSSSSSSSENESDSEDDENRPSGAECLNRCKQFAEFTSTDSALAMYFLQNNKWDLENALNMFFRQTKQVAAPNSKVVAVFDVDKLNEDEERHSRDSNKRAQEEESSSSANRNGLKKRKNSSDESKSASSISFESSPEQLVADRKSVV